ncbi:unnamed protein product [Prunus brigantina]
MSQGDHVWSTDMLEVSSRWVGEFGDGPLVPLTYYDENDIHKKLDLGPDTTNVLQALNILARWELHGSNLDDLPVEQEKSSTKLPHSSSSKSSVRGSRLLRMSLWELLVHHQGLSCLCRSWDQTERTVHLSSNHDSSAKPRTVKRGADSMLQVTAKRAKESSARAKSP